MKKKKKKKKNLGAAAIPVKSKFPSNLQSFVRLLSPSKTCRRETSWHQDYSLLIRLTKNSCKKDPVPGLRQ
jgi:hypothetical protein